MQFIKKTGQTLLVALLLALGLALGPVGIDPARAQDGAFSPAQSRAIETIVREYLLANPEIIREMVTELERRQAAAQEQRQREALARIQDDLVTENDVVLGNPDGDVTLVEFFDYNCSFCKRALGDVEKMIAADPNLRVVLKDLPILSPGSQEAARIGIAALRQFSPAQAAEFHVRLMRQDDVDGAKAIAIAREIGIDLDRLQADVNGPEVYGAIERNMRLAEELGVSGTPAWIVGETVISGAVGVPRLAAAVDNVRRCGTVAC